MDYKVLNIITEQDRVDLIKLYNNIPSTKAVQDYNLFTVDKRRIQSDNFKIDAFKKLDEYANRPTYSHYFVMYEEGSFTRMHTDNDDDISLTIVTLLDSQDLVGGETIVHLPAEYKGRDANEYRKGDVPRDDQRVRPKVVNVDKGQSMIYNRSLLHGVAEVEKGKRLVLVSWYGKTV
jgi:predicted 2-oxoglutarate/Fe(II)-dependent dioxygenase YbiX